MIANTFCSEVTDIIIDVIKQLAQDMVGCMDPSKMTKSDTHSTMARKIRDVSSLCFTFAPERNRLIDWGLMHKSILLDPLLIDHRLSERFNRRC